MIFIVMHEVVEISLQRYIIFRQLLHISFCIFVRESHIIF